MAYSGWSSRVLCLLASLVLALAVGMPAGAQAVLEAPVNPDFQRDATRALTGGAPGYRPSPVDWSHLRGGRLAVRAVLPAAYDLRAQGRVTAVRNQASSGSCWAFGALASMESCLLPGEITDFSENNLKNTHGFDPHPNTGGGNRDMASAYLARWNGPVNEADDPYNPSSTTSPTLAARRHMQQVIYLPDRTGPTDNDAIKQAVMTYGAVMTLYYANNTYFKPETNGYYNPYTTSVNHAVAIVGWDDHYSASNFTVTPPGNGAFIVKNSWGADWGDGGYFYMSYYEPTVLQNTVYYNAESASNYSRCYQYDTLGMVSSMGYGNNTGWLANVFTAAGSDLISAVSTYAQKPGTTYQVSIYLEPTSGPAGGTPAATQSGTFTDAGYHTVILTSPVQVEPGARFSVVMRLTTPGYNYPIPVERPFTGYTSAAVAASGQSYISASGTSWTDLAQSTANANVCLKAFAQPGSAGPALTAVGLAANPASPQAAGTPVTLVATPTGGASVLYKFEASLNGSWTTLREYSSGNSTAWTPDAPGSYTLKVSAYDAADPETVVTRTLSYTVLAPLTAVALDASLASPQGLGRTIRLTAAATGGAVVQYRFLASSNAGASWAVLRDYGTAAYFDWAPAATGDYLVKVLAREGASGTPVGAEAIPFTIALAPTDVSLAAAPASPQPAGTEIALTATKTGGEATVQYRFEVSANGGASWSVLRDFGSATETWAPQSAGSYLLKVTAREPELPAITVSDTLAYVIVEPLSAVSLSASLPSPQPVNRAVRLTAAKTGGASVQYQYAASADGGATWTVVQAYTALAYEDWTPAVPGSYLLKVAAREGATGAPVESAPIAFTVAPAPPTAVALTASPASPQYVGAAVTLAAVRTGGTASVQYQFEVSADGGASWTVLRAFAAASTLAWTPQATGSCLLKVTVREPLLPALAVSGTLAFSAVEPLSAVALAPSPASPQPIKTMIRLNAEPTGGISVQYQYYLSTNGGVSWSILQKWTTAGEKDWKPTSNRDYLLKVEAREGAAGVPVASEAYHYTITPAPPTSVKLTAGPASPRTAHTPITLKATKSGGKYVEYKFEASTNGGAAWTTLRDFNALAAADWMPATPANYTLRVSARESALPAVVVTATLPFSIAEPLTGIALTTPQDSLQIKSTRIQLSAAPVGGANVQYLFSYSKNNGLTWSTLRNWNKVAELNWTPSSPGDYLVRVSAREDKTGTPVTSTALAFTIVPKPPTAVSLSAKQRSPQLADTPIQLKAKKKGGSVVQYQFEASANHGATWTVLQPFSSASTCDWQPAIPAEYRLRVMAREATYPIAPVTGTLDYAIVPPLTAVALSTPATSPRAVNQPVVLDAVATGGMNVKYQFSLSSNDGATWSVIQSWTSTTTKTWKPTRVGVYLLKVAARDGNGLPVESAAVPYAISAVAENSMVAWKVNLIARTGLESALVSVGESEIMPTVVEADETGGAMTVYLEQPGQPALAADYRTRSVGRQQWQFVVRRNPEAADFTDIVLTWPEVGKAPRELSFTLVDLATGERRYMRTATHYVIPASRGVGDNRFQVIASREPVVPLQIVGLAPAETSRAAGSRVSYTLTRPAQVTLTVRALSGRVVYRLAASQAQAAGLNTLLWDGRSSAGARVPAGTYQVELLANDSEDFRIRAVTLVSLR